MENTQQLWDLRVCRCLLAKKVRLICFSTHPLPQTAFYIFLNCEADQNNKTGIKSDLAEEL